MPGGADDRDPVRLAGRPRLRAAREPGRGRQDMLDAAAQLFTERGYAATSTRAIADAAGVRQASLYYHFPSKEALLAELLDRTVRPSLDFVARLHAEKAAPAVALHALASYDVELLYSGSLNLGALYLLPELRTDPFAAFRADREALRAAYAAAVAAVETSGAPTGPPPTTGTMADMVFGLVESVIIMRLDDRGLDRFELTQRVADSCLRLLGFTETGLGHVRSSSLELRRRLAD